MSDTNSLANRQLYKASMLIKVDISERRKYLLPGKRAKPLALARGSPSWQVNAEAYFLHLQGGDRTDF